MKTSAKISVSVHNVNGQLAAFYTLEGYGELPNANPMHLKGGFEAVPVFLKIMNENVIPSEKTFSPTSEGPMMRGEYGGRRTDYPLYELAICCSDGYFVFTFGIEFGNKSTKFVKKIQSARSELNDWIFEGITSEEFESLLWATNF
jgi:hypothetical protein